MIGCLYLTMSDLGTSLPLSGNTDIPGQGSGRTARAYFSRAGEGLFFLPRARFQARFDPRVLAAACASQNFALTVRTGRSHASSPSRQAQNRVGRPRPRDLP